MNTHNELYTSLDRFLNSLTGRNLSEHTSKAYETDLTQFLTWLTENDISVTSLEKITRTHILDYLTHPTAIREYCKFLFNERLLAHSFEHIVRPKQRVSLLIDEYIRLLNAAAGNSLD